MSVIWARENAKDRSTSGTAKEGNKYARSFFVRVDSPDTSVDDIVNACGIAFNDAYPNWAGSLMQSFDCKPADDSGLLWSVTFNYEKQLTDRKEEGGDSNVEGKVPTWSASSSVTTGPATEDVDGDALKNSAGDLMEGLEKECAEFRLSLTQYFLSHAGWRDTAKAYTNAVNDAEWNGGAADEWKCQGCSAKLNIESQSGAVLVYWEVAWEFAYRAGGWQLQPWDIGFAQLVDEEGNPSSNGTERQAIKGQDKKSVRQPVFLANGVALAPGQQGNKLFFQVYERVDFGTKFGQLYTPG